MRREAKKLLLDMRTALSNPRAFVHGRPLDEYLDDLQLRSAVERQLEILGEAARRLTEREPDVARRIPNLRRIVDFRNVLIHGYSDVDSRIVWGTLEGFGPPLEEFLARLLAEPEE